MTKIQWKALDWPGLEDCEISHDGKTWTAKGDIHAEYELGTPIHVTYKLEIADDWTAKSIALHIQDGPSLHLRRDEFYHWKDDNGPRPGFNGCRFVDVSLSPITNSMPINALPFKKDDRQVIDVAYINGFTLEAHRVQQYYTKTGDNTYLYEDVESPDFMAEITVDRAGLVVEYPGLFTRLKT
jgi:uncharacterized protein